MAEASENKPSVSVVVPVLDGRTLLAQTLPALLRALEGHAYELIVVDDGSRDESASYAASLGARVLETGRRGSGPAYARNLGVSSARSELILFVDADVAVHEDVISQALKAFETPEVVAVFGAYDDAPPDQSFSSQYMNLRHHHVHQSETNQAQTFWTGLGAVRRQAFRSVGGFDSDRYPVPSIEDIDLGRRLREAGGQILRWPSMQGTHLKAWSVGEVIRTDVMRRALPWARLMQRYPGAFTDLNVGPGERFKALVAGLLALSLVLAVFRPAFLFSAVLLFGLALFVNADLFRLFRERNGVGFAVRALLYHQAYYLYSASVFVFAAAEGLWLTPARRTSRSADI